MKIFNTVLFLFLSVCLTVSGAEKLAVAEPVNKGALSPAEIEAIWAMLETKVDGGFEVISRSALKSMLTEAGLAQESGLVDANSKKAEFGKLKGVAWLLVPTVTKLGNRISFSLQLIHCSTGEIDRDRKGSVTVADVGMLSDRMDDILVKMRLGKPSASYGRIALLYPVIQVPLAPLFLSSEINTRLQTQLLAGGVKLVGTQNLAKIMKDNNLAALDQAERAQFVRLAELLEADFLMIPVVTRFGIEKKSTYVEATRRNVVRHIGNMDGYITLRSAKTGDITATIPFEKKVDFSEIDDDTEDWTPTDYYKYLIRQTIPAINPAGLSASGKK